MANYINILKISNQNVHQICTFFALKKVKIRHYFFGAFVIVLLTKVVPNSTIIRCSFGLNILKHAAKFISNIVQICKNSIL